jgi:hypothetical protein
MKLINLNSTKGAILAATAVLAAGILSLQPWRLIAQPSSNAPPPLAALTGKASVEDSPWSKPVKGLRARLLVLPSEKADSPFCRVFIELENVAEVMGQKKIRFSPDKLSLRVSNKEGGELPPPTDVDYDGMSPLWETIALPYAGSLKFQISFPGVGYHPGTDKVIVDVGTDKVWVIPQDGTTCFLSGSLTIEDQKSDHPIMDWSGTLDLPKAEIPKAK